MRKQILNLLVVGLIGLLSNACTDNPMPGVSYGFVNAEVNGKSWNQTYKNAYQATYALEGTYGSAIPCNNYITLSSDLYNEHHYLRQTLEIIKLTLKKGKYLIVPFQNGYCLESDPVYAAFFTSTSDGDVAGDAYKVLASEDNYIEIESYNVKTKEIKANFNITFVLERQGGGHVLEDTLRFKNGKIYTRIIDKRKR